MLVYCSSLRKTRPRHLRKQQENDWAPQQYLAENGGTDGGGRRTFASHPFVTLNSDGVVLIYGCDAQAVEAGNLLKAHLDVTVLITPPATVVAPPVNEFPIAKGRIRSAKGHLGAFEITVDDFAEAAPSSRSALSFRPSRHGAVSRCDIVLDLSGGVALFPAADLRDGYLRADPGSPTAVLSAVLKAQDLTGTFDKPRYITFSDDLCAHSRSQIVGCTRCLDLCPTSAIVPSGDHVRSTRIFAPAVVNALPPVPRERRLMRCRPWTHCCGGCAR